MRALLLAFALIAAGCAAPDPQPGTGSSPSGTATTATTPATGATTNPTTSPTTTSTTDISTLPATSDELSGIQLTVSAVPNGTAYILTARAENVGTEPWSYYPACEMAWAHNMTDPEGLAFTYRMWFTCAGSPTESLDPGASHTLQVDWAGTRYDASGTESQVAPGTYAWVVTFRAGPASNPVQHGVSAMLEVDWPPPA